MNPPQYREAPTVVRIYTVESVRSNKMQPDSLVWSPSSRNLFEQALHRLLSGEVDKLNVIGDGPTSEDYLDPKLNSAGRNMVLDLVAQFDWRTISYCVVVSSPENAARDAVEIYLERSPKFQVSLYLKGLYLAYCLLQLDGIVESERDIISFLNKDKFEGGEIAVKEPAIAALRQAESFDLIKIESEMPAPTDGSENYWRANSELGQWTLFGVKKGSSIKMAKTLNKDFPIGEQLAMRSRLATIDMMIRIEEHSIRKLQAEKSVVEIIVSKYGITP